MKNWEAMLKGCKIRPQAFVQMYDGHGSCAVGAMFEGHGNLLCHETSSDAWKMVHDIDVQFKQTKCPAKCGFSSGLGTVIWHLNDSHWWSRELIAYFVREIEDPKAVKKQKIAVAA